MQTQLQVYRDGHKSAQLIQPLLPGEHGTIQELAIMARIVREDAPQPDLRKFVLKEVLGRGVRGHDEEAEINALFHFAQHRIVYRKDPVGVERIADVWSTMYALSPGEPEGDCGIKSTFFATCLALLGYEPYFVVIRQLPTDATFRHVYVGLTRNGQYKAYDPTPEEKPAGFEAKHFERAFYRIF